MLALITVFFGGSLLVVWFAIILVHLELSDLRKELDDLRGTVHQMMAANAKRSR
jgi:hypothetical protein